MSKSLSVASVIEKNRLSSDTPFLLCLDIAIIDPGTAALIETLRVVHNTEPLAFNGFEYTAANFDIELKEEAGTQSSIILSIRDYTRAVQQRMQLYGGGVGFTVTVMVVNSGALQQPPEIIEHFVVTGSSSSSYVCSFTLGAENGLTKAFPRRRQAKDFCQWRYKDENCRYSGTLGSCDLSLKGANGCLVHDNVFRFGAFPGISGRDTRYG